MNEDVDRPNVKIHPPTLFFAALVLGYLVRLFEGGSMPLPRAFAEGVGGLLIIVGLAIVLSAVSQFAKAGEQLPPRTPSHQLLTSGPYKYSRNPIYFSMIVFGTGLGIATSNIWIVVATFAAGAILHLFVIVPEEKYLSRRFHDEYELYRKKVRRWI